MTAVNKVVKNLESKKLIKAVNSVSVCIFNLLFPTLKSKNSNIYYLHKFIYLLYL